ncbi:universal stress protein [Aquimarina algiphila]|uniref:universal stress protein n=1 Tax=Aquimarina algiphila TaxID=2047982 RepID=UPI00232BE8B8|nr:universal stress protein [Aquimarina algiphila]
MKNILYATDYTEHSVSALRYAYDLSSRIKARLIVLHVFDVMTFTGTTVISSLRQTSKRLYEEQYSILKEYCIRHLGNNLSDMNIQIEVARNISITEEILLKVKELSVDMVVIGIKDKYSKRGFLEGDIAKKLITKISCPLMVIPNNSIATEIKNIVYATDFEEEDIFAIKRLLEIAAFFEATIHVVHISSKEKDEDENQMAWFKEMLFQKVSYPNLEFDVLVSDNIHDKLNEYLKSLDADIIAMLERGRRGFIKKLFHKDVVKQIESHTTIPLLSFNIN